MLGLARKTMLATLLGAVAGCAVLWPITAPSALGSEQTAKSLLDQFSTGRVFDPSKLVKFGDDLYSVNVESSVSADVTERHIIRKIGMGRTSFVEIVTTPTGTYSSDGLASPYVRYPGIEVEQLGHAAPYWYGGLLGWSADHGWVPLPMIDAKSFLVITSAPGTVVKTTPHGSCIWTKGTRVCV